jgi:amino acid transporter
MLIWTLFLQKSLNLCVLRYNMIILNSSKKIFAREATGLVRSLNWVDGMIMNLAYYNIAVASFLIFGYGSFLFPGANMIITLGLIALLVDLPVVVTYSLFSISMPRSGGDYIFVSRSVHPALGFATGLVFFVFLSTFSVGQNAYFATATVLAPGLAGIGSVTSNSYLISLSQYLLKPTTLIALGLVFLAITFFLLSIHPERLHRVILTLFIVAALGYPVFYVLALALSSHTAFVNAFNSYAVKAGLNTSYDEIIKSAIKQGAVIEPLGLAASVAALPIAYATVAFPQSSTYIAGETKQATKQVPLSLISALLIICGVTALMGYYTYKVFGYEFISATAYYGFSGAQGYPLPAPPFTDYFLVILYPNVAFAIFMIVAGIAWEFLLMIAFGLMATRFLFASSFDQLLPKWLADVSERFHTPIKATVVSLILAVVFLVSTAYSFIGTYFTSIPAWTSGYWIVMLSGFFFPFIGKEVYNRCPPIVKSKILGLPSISFSGLLGMISLGVVMYYLVNDPSVSGISVQGILFVSTIYLTGIVIYFAVKNYRKREGIDISLAFKEIPPE